MSRTRYVESPLPAAVADVCEALWEVRFETATEDWLVLPDGCVDIVLLDGRDAPLVAGPSTGPQTSSYPAGARAVGLRLLPGAAPSLLGVAASELRDQTIELSELSRRAWTDGSRRAHEHLLAGDAAKSGAMLLDVLSSSARAARIDPVARHAAELLRHDPNLPVASVASLVSISERQLNRRFTTHVGYGPKQYARVMRLQYLMRLHARHPTAHLGWLAAQAGYADQAHLVHESKRLAGRVPTQLLAQRATVLSQEHAK